MVTASPCRHDAFLCEVAKLQTVRPSASTENLVSVPFGPGGLQFSRSYAALLVLPHGADISSSNAGASGKRIKIVLTDRKCLFKVFDGKE